MADKHIKLGLESHKKLAQERTILASERNTLAYIRTGLGAFILGFGLINLFKGDGIYVYGGYFSLILGAVFVILGLIYYSFRKKRILSY